MNLTVRKYDPADPSRVYLDEAKAIYSSTSYDLTVVADDFKTDRSSVCYAKLLRSSDDGLVEYATCSLSPDPYRRDRRVGVMVVCDSAHQSLFEELSSGDTPSAYDFVLSVVLGASGNKVIHAQVPVVVAAKVVTASSDSGSGESTVTVKATDDLWKTYDLGTLETGVDTVETRLTSAFSVRLRDRSITHGKIDLRDLGKTYDFHIVPVDDDNTGDFAGDVFEAVFVLTTVEDKGCQGEKTWQSAGATDSTTRKLGNIYVGSTMPSDGRLYSGSAFCWDYRDSGTVAAELDSTGNKFVVRVRRLPYDDRWHAEFRVYAASPIGVDCDPDGNSVPAAAAQGLWCSALS